jgi:hypothetical protein
VDGYYVGVVDSFDGVFQRLDLPTGEHEVVVHLPGYRSYRQKNLFRPGESYHFKAILEPLPPGTPDEPVPQPAPGNPEPRESREPRRAPRSVPPAAGAESAVPRRPAVPARSRPPGPDAG